MAKLQRFLSAVDETLCDHVVCQHPLCWETMRRLERGLPRMRLQSEPKLPPESEGDLPPLNILELPQWSADQAIDVSIVPLTPRKTAACSQSYKPSSHPDNLQSASLVGTSMGSSLDFMRFTRSRSCSPVTRDRPVNLKKVEVIELEQQTSSCDQYLGKTMFIWVPNLLNKRKWQKKHTQSIVTPQSVSVKEISFQGQPYDELVGLSVEQKQKQKMKKKAKKKPATGGQPYTYLARKQQSLKRWKDTLHPLYKEHRNEFPEVMKGILTQADHSDHVAEQGLTQQYSAAKSQPLFNRYEYQGARKIPARIMPIPVSKKVTLHHFTEKQKQAQSTWHFRGSQRMDGQHLEIKRLSINDLKLRTCFDNNLSVLQKNRGSDQDYLHPPSPVSSANDECTQPYHDPIDTLNMNRDTPSFITDSRFLSDLQLNLLMVVPGSQETGSSALTTSMYSQKNNLLTVSTAKVPNAKWIKEQKLSAATKMGSSIMEQAGSKDQSSSPADKQQEQEDLSTATEMAPPTVEQAGSGEQSAIAIDKQDQQQVLNSAAEVEPSIVEQAGSEDQSTIPVDKEDQQQDLSTATEVRPSTVEQVGSEDPSRFPIAKQNEQQDLSTATDVGPPTMEQGDSEDQSSFPTVERDELQEIEWADTEDRSILIVVGMNEQEDLSTATEMEFPVIDQGVKDQSDLITERNEQQDLGAVTESTALIWEQRNDERSEDPLNGITIAESVEGQDMAVPNETLSSLIVNMDQGKAWI